MSPVDSVHVDARKACLLHQLGRLDEVGHLGLDVLSRQGAGLARRVPHNGELARRRKAGVAAQAKGQLHKHLGSIRRDARVDLLARAHEGGGVVQHGRSELLEVGVDTHTTRIDEAKATLRTAHVVVDPHLREAAVRRHVKARIHRGHGEAILDGGLANGERAR